MEKDRVYIKYYTDPLCCWSWAFEPHWKRLLEEFSELISYRYFMGGLISDWKNYNDPLNTVTRPAQMGPLWMEARNISGVYNDERLWSEDPPSSSYPACIAVKCALLQSKQAEELYLLEVRKAALTQRKNIARQNVLMEIAKNLEVDYPDIFSYNEFKTAMKNEEGRNLFRTDLQTSKYLDITRFPSLTLHREGHRGILIVGYRPYEILMAAMREIAQDLVVKHDEPICW